MRRGVPREDEREVRRDVPRDDERDVRRDVPRDDVRDVRREDDFRAGTFAPFSRASDNPIAIACLRLVTRPP